ncbi:methionyl-tRNA formyltransferase [uncultured Oscillibacter sp.]|uniref:methionyl-tRNA formyltransferase n=1 Tax=uncultured Oscillibacter sp. TaxID=876091 RepID=UPI0025F892ED|nr:methionyl-tRNA formyltransferase [uncultured Oscillibacter sp.]
MRVLFMGTPEFAVASLRRLAEDGHEICGVVTQPDKPKNRGMKLIPTPVKEYAMTLGLDVFQPQKARDGEATDLVRRLAPELIVAAAYGKILPEELLNYPKYGSINVHSSLLPKYRGAAPINWAILNGDEETGVSIMYMVDKLDAGDVISKVKTPIGPDEDAQSLTARLAELGAEALSGAIAAIESGTVVRTAQNEDAATYAPMLSRDLSPIDWTKSAHAINCQIRGLIPWPAASAVVDGRAMKVFKSQETGEETSAEPGTVLSADKRGIAVACGDGKVLCLTEIQADGGKRMPVADYLRGHPIQL